MQINYKYRVQKHVSISYKSFLLHYKVIQIKHILIIILINVCLWWFQWHFRFKNIIKQTISSSMDHYYKIIKIHYALAHMAGTQSRES